MVITEKQIKYSSHEAKVIIHKPAIFPTTFFYIFIIISIIHLFLILLDRSNCAL